jgi:tetratricopeptide (TPR) repeat protein
VAQNLQARRRYDEALETLESALRLAPDEPELQVRKARFLLDQARATPATGPARPTGPSFSGPRSGRSPSTRGARKPTTFSARPTATRTGTPKRGRRGKRRWCSRRVFPS